jgi:capsular polysaccharide biosynthesis protein
VDHVDLAATLSELRSKIGLIVLMAVVAGAAAFIVSSLLPKSYTAEARVLVGSLTDSNYDQLLAYGQLAQTYAQLAGTTPVLAGVITELGLDMSPESLAQRLDVRAPTGLSIIRIQATGTSPEQAAQLANAVAGQIAKIAKQAPPATGSLASIVQEAQPPASASAPRVLLNSVVAAALGLALGVIVALIPAYRRSTRAEVATRLETVRDA